MEGALDALFSSGPHRGPFRLRCNHSFRHDRGSPALPRIREPAQPPRQVFALATPAHTSWHISDWVGESFDVRQREHLAHRSNGAIFDLTATDSLLKFQDVLREKHRSLHICWQIATGSKHKNIRKPDPVIKVEEVWVNQSQAGIMRCGQPLGWHRQELIIYDDEKKRRAIEVFEEAADCWDGEFRSWGFLESGRKPLRLRNDDSPQTALRSGNGLSAPPLDGQSVIVSHSTQPARNGKDLARHPA
jgi:hypothetical protein